MTTGPVAPTSPFDNEARRVPALNGARWLAGGWRLLRQAWWQWPLLVLLVMVLHGLILNLPIASGLLSMLLMPVFSAGLGAFALGIESRGERRLSLLFAGFRKRLASLALSGLLTFLWILAGVIITALVAVFVVGQDTLDVIAISGVLDGGQLLIILGLSALLLGLTAPATLAFWFAPLLIHANDIGVSAGLKASLRGTLRNWPALLINGLILSLVLFVLGLSVAVGTMVVTFITPLTLVLTLPLLGLFGLLLMTWMCTTWLAAFRDLYARETNNQTE